MDIKNSTRRFIFILSILLFIFSATSYAQRGWGRHHGFNRGYYHMSRGYAYQPYVSIGFRSGYYRHYGGYYYRAHYRYYQPIPHFGIRVMVLPPGYRRIYVGAYPYYYQGGVYYVPLANRGYQTVKPPIGARILELPGDAQAVILDGQKYYVFDGTYYKEMITSDNRVEYEVVSTDGQMYRDREQDPGVQGNDNYRPQIGERIDKLPSGSRSIVIRDKKYYEAPDGTYYEEIISPNKVEYEVVAKPD